MKLTLAALAALSAAAVYAQDVSDISVDAEVAVYNKYVWRGINLTNGAVFQPSITLGWQKWSLNFWGNHDLTNVNGLRGRFNEVDTTLSYSDDLEGGSFSVGAINYDFPNTGLSSTAELFATYSLNQRLSPTFGVNWDIDEADGAYFTASIGDSFDIPMEGGNLPSLDWTAKVGFGTEGHNNFYYGNRETSFADWSLMGTFNWNAGPGEVFITTGFTGLLDGGHLRGASNRSNWLLGGGYRMSF